MKLRYVYIGITAILIYSHFQQKNDAKIFILKKLPYNFNAITLPPIGIFLTENEKNNQTLIEHEKIHWNQFKNMGLLSYIITYITDNLKNGYDNNKMELEARKNENTYCQNNYTNCVRNGMAKTVFNLNFRK